MFITILTWTGPWSVMPSRSIALTLGLLSSLHRAGIPATSGEMPHPSEPGLIAPGAFLFLPPHRAHQLPKVAYPNFDFRVAMSDPLVRTAIAQARDAEAAGQPTVRVFIPTPEALRPRIEAALG